MSPACTSSSTATRRGPRTTIGGRRFCGTRWTAVATTRWACDAFAAANSLRRSIHFRRALQRLQRRNPNPYDGEALYNLGVTLRYLGRDEEAYGAFYKATWNAAWSGPGYHALAEIDCGRGDWATALDHLDMSLRRGSDNLRARNLKAVVLRRLGREEAASALLRRNAGARSARSMGAISSRRRAGERRAESSRPRFGFCAGPACTAKL